MPSGRSYSGLRRPFSSFFSSPCSKNILLPFVAGIAIAYFLSPIADRLVALGLNRIVASLLIVAAGAVVVVVLAIVLVPLLAAQTQEIAIALPGEIQRLREPLEAWMRERLGPVFPGIEGQLGRAGDVLAPELDQHCRVGGDVGLGRQSRHLQFSRPRAGDAAGRVLSSCGLAPDSGQDRRLAPRDHAASIRTLASDMNEAISAFVRGQGTVCIILGLFYALSLSLIGLNYGLLVGLATGLLSFVPFVGWALGFITATTLALVVQSWPELTPAASRHRCFCCRPGARCWVPQSVDRRLQNRTSSRVVDLCLVRLQLFVRLRRRARRRACRRCARGADPLRLVRLSPKPRVHRRAFFSCSRVPPADLRDRSMSASPKAVTPQLPLELPHRAAQGAEDFLVSSANAAAVDIVDAWPNWAYPAIGVIGPRGAGEYT